MAPQADFAHSFWSTDYAAGLGVLFAKLQQGVVEDRQILTVARLRAEAEETYGQRLSEIAPSVDKIQGGFSRDDGASTRKAYEGVRTEMEDAGKSHKRIAQGIRDLVVTPFGRWCDAHEARIQDSQDELQGRIKAYDRQSETVKKLRSTYFSKCRLVEDVEEEDKLAFKDPENSPKPKIPEIKVSSREDDYDDNEPFEIGDEVYQPEQVKKILQHMLANIKLGETKVPILGTYLNTSAGSDIVEYLQRNMGSSSISYAERIGQDLVTHGFLRLVGNVGNTFANSSKLFYQWRPKAFQMSGVPEKKQPLNRTFSLPAGGSTELGDSPLVGTVNEYLANWNVISNGPPGETPSERMRRESKEADEKYKAGVLKLDEMRCALEEAIFVHLKFLERCELDRLKAIKTVVLDFSGTISNVIPSLQSTVDKMMLYQETVQPVGDLRYLLENYRTGSFVPKVTIYENYYNRVDEQQFGVDLEARARADKKRVPVIITSILTYLDHHYPDLEGDEARRGVWLVDVPLAQTHKLRQKVNGRTFPPDVFSEFDIPTVASLLKLYLLELPDSLVSSHVYEIIRTIYSTPTPDAADGARVAVLQQTLSQLRLTNIATLDACMNHFTRLIDLTSADEKYVAELATTMAPAILRPRAQTSLTMEEKHAYRLLRDLLAHKEAIFSELKRMSTLTHSTSVTQTDHRLRAPSTDESNRKAHMEERTRAILEKAGGSRSRATSPAPGPRIASVSGSVAGAAAGATGSGAAASAAAASGPAGSVLGHRRDRSIGGPETRFPISTSPRAATDRNRQSIGAELGVKRSSLEVPGAEGGVPPASTVADPAATNGNSHAAVADLAASEGLVEKRNSLGRSGARFVGGRRVAPSSGSTASGQQLQQDASDSPHHGVTLVDKPMDD